MNCECCGSSELKLAKYILWKDLIEKWNLSVYEIYYINMQQGFCCTSCGCNLRSMILAKAIMSCYSYTGLFKNFVSLKSSSKLKILEINEAGYLTQFLKKIPNHIIKGFPEIDMMNLCFEDNEFDLVIHSDTLEHVQDPIKGLIECKRVLKDGRFCVFTVPMIVDRLTSSRKGLPDIFHGTPSNSRDFLVYTDYGADGWKHLILAGFKECHILSLEYPIAQALVGIK